MNSANSIGRLLEARRGQVERARSIQGQTQVVVGFIDVVGAGEALVDVNFPLLYIERPIMTFGGELAENEVLVDGNFPTISLIVKQWKTEVRNTATYYVGATLAVVTSGAADMKLIGHWRAEAVALYSPMLGNNTTDDTI